MALRKNAGPTLTSKRKGDATVVPERIRAIAGVTETKQANPNDIEPTTNTATLVESRVEADRTDERVKVDVTLQTTGLVATDQRITREFGGGVLDVTSTLGDDTQEVAGGTMVFDSELQQVGTVATLLTTATNPEPEWPLLFGTRIDEATGLAIDISRQAVAAGSLGGFTYTESSFSISTVEAGTPVVISRANGAQHHLFPGDLVTISGVIGTIAAQINGIEWEVTPINSYQFTIGLSSTNTGVSGLCTRNTDDNNEIYYEIQPLDKWLSIRIGSRVNIQDAPTFSAPAMVEYETLRTVTPVAKAPIGANGTIELVGSVIKVLSGDQQDADVGVYYNTTPALRRVFQGWTQVSYHTAPILANLTLPNVLYKLGGGDSADGLIMVSQTSARAWSVRVPQSETFSAGYTQSPAGYVVVAARVDQLPLGVFRLTIISIKKSELGL